MGFYPPPPDHKIWYDSDGTAVYTQIPSNGAISAVSPATAQNMNGENTAASGPFISTNNRLGFVFPVPTDIAGAFLIWDGSSSGVATVSTSTDTTNGADGNWTQQTATFPALGPSDSFTKYRTNITALTYPSIRGFRLQPTSSSGSIWQFHLYGHPSTGQNPDRLRFWHPTSDAEVAPSFFDFGDLRQTLTSVIQFRVKNNSTAKTANTITVNCSAITNPNPTLTSQTQFSTNGTTYSSSVNVATLAPGATSSILYARLTLASNAQIGPWRQRIRAAAASFT